MTPTYYDLNSLVVTWNESCRPKLYAVLWWGVM
jgi:hypothetical protein